MKQGPYVSPYDLPEINLEDTPLYEFYDDYHKDSKGHPLGTEDEDPPTSETGLDTKVLTPEYDE